MAKKEENNQSQPEPVEDNGIGHVPDESVEVVDDRDTRPRDYITFEEPTPEPVVTDNSPANDIGHVPDPPFHGKYKLEVAVNFANAEGGETVVEAGIIEGSSLPLDVAESLAARGLLTKV